MSSSFGALPPAFYNATRRWFVVDATGKAVGRIATDITKLLMGKHKPSYDPSRVSGDNVIVVNAEKVLFTGKKWDQKIYYKHTGHPGGLKETKAKDLLEKKPEEILKKAVKGMLPKNRLQDDRLSLLRVYAGSEHKHEAQQPESIHLGRS
mmetsp:Transcript_37545/g.96902  ORF Transcript_37545/g.96902 Transcript_37545/m.96902 type:complete len:150 (-) Transcript_37545:299-748(-)|eukprot:CAMPEP_0113871770 /NCGR_PEP_ID=MMETSP0780_2-20120614/2832_1 /TAXON_ID=652834 /ORGANISM="Palpitomonas bilix" /LENGTH=149 /DNA_ID=CAMNT_0000857207 /DNA_START=48 /DNA_END=497 /DNA_ORIENTATION=+ /assembly_acc=CAM_ASM_000599